MNQKSAKSEFDDQCRSREISLGQILLNQNSNSMFSQNDLVRSTQQDEYLQVKMETQPEQQEIQLEQEQNMYQQYQQVEFQKRGLMLIDNLDESPSQRSTNQETAFTNIQETNFEQCLQSPNDYLSENSTQEQQIYQEEPVENIFRGQLAQQQDMFNQFNCECTYNEIKVEEDFNQTNQFESLLCGNYSVEQPLYNNKPQKGNKKIKKDEKKTYKYDTKNVLRNFGAAQTNFIKHNKAAFECIKQIYGHLNDQERSENIKQFYEWCPQRPVTFPQYQKLWSAQGEFYDVYRAVCKLFYEQFAANHIYQNSKVCEEMKGNHCKYIHRFIEGIQNPSDFTYLKNH